MWWLCTWAIWKLTHWQHVGTLPCGHVPRLNDLFGIQARGGCACAGPYGQTLLGLDAATAKAFDEAKSLAWHHIFRVKQQRVLLFNHFNLQQRMDFLSLDFFAIPSVATSCNFFKGQIKSQSREECFVPDSVLQATVCIQKLAVLLFVFTCFHYVQSMSSLSWSALFGKALMHSAQEVLRPGTSQAFTSRERPEISWDTLDEA